MLIRTDPLVPFDIHRTQRLIHLETKLRQKSDSTITISEYKAFLEQLEVKSPSLRTLQEDLRRYTKYCDDVIYGNKAKKLKLDPDATQDAIIWLLGVSWLDSPLRPRISSSCTRCLLLAKELKAEVAINYRSLRKLGEPWTPKEIVGIPIRAIPGTDSGYFQLHIANGLIMNINLSRVLRFVNFTEKNTDHYVPIAKQQQLLMTLETQDHYLLERLVTQFAGLKKHNQTQATMVVEESLQRMTLDILEGHLARTKTTQRYLPHQTTIEINENVSIHFEKLK